MNAIELLRAGKLTDARASLAQAVKEAPSDHESRALLFKVLAFLGEWDKAELHLDILAQSSAGRTGELQLYKKLVAAERQREEVRLHRQVPDFMTEAPGYLGNFLAAREEIARGHGEQLTAVLPVIEDALFGVAGRANGVPFQGVADADVTLLPFLEVFVHDRYLWFPFTSLRELSVQRPVSFLDLLWSRGRIVTWEGLTSECVLPVLYPGSWEHENELVRLGRMTDWGDLGAGYKRGFGQHLFLVGEEAKGLLELGEVQFKFPKAGQAL
jgi:type VI secretion system protein ImpE